MYYGFVFNENGEPLSGVKVSDGRNIVLTREDGGYELPGWERANLIFVCTLTRHHSDFYRYIDKEQNRYDFYISPYVGKRDESSFLHISDTEIFIDGFTYDKWEDFIKSARDESGADFLIHTGDICRRRGLEAHGRLLNSDNFSIPVRYTLGNHDYVDDKYGEYTFERLYGPVWYSFDLSGTHYVCLPINRGEAKGLYQKDDSFIWLEEDLKLAGGLPVVIFCHTYCEQSEKDYVIKLDSRTLDLKKEGLLAWVFGHLHVNYLREDNGVFTIGTARPDCGGIDSSVGGCRYVRIKNGKLQSHIIYNRKNSVRSKNKKITENSNFTAPIYAEGGIFTACFDDGYPKKSRIVRTDPNSNEVWSCKTRGSVKHNMLYEEGVIYALDTEGYLLSLTADSGRLINQAAIPSVLLSYFPAEIVLYGDEIIIPANDRMYFYNKHTLELKDEVKVAGSVSTVSKPIIHKGRIYWAKHWTGLYVIDLKTKEIINFNKDIIDSVASPLAVDDKIFFPTRYSIACTDLDGNILYQNGGYGECAFASISTPVYYRDRLYFGTTFGGVVEFDPDTLTELRRFECGEALIPVFSYIPLGAKASAGSPIIEDDRLIFASVDGCVYFYDLINGSLIKRIDIGAPVISGITKTDDGFLVCDFDSKITFIR